MGRYYLSTLLMRGRFLMSCMDTLTFYAIPNQGYVSEKQQRHDTFKGAVALISKAGLASTSQGLTSSE